ncbi:hypothetical protein TNCT_34261 [Trichonephila clavata]|uniref:Granulins domain-containing protein n=1 Tax=Trichonephila clavata TaxID=2740835 RepID=A0A8X6HRP2_TRICU|nr:hypothetical protein TNCT_34261 [Trichonephila clavata]
MHSVWSAVLEVEYLGLSRRTALVCCTKKRVLWFETAAVVCVQEVEYLWFETNSHRVDCCIKKPSTFGLRPTHSAWKELVLCLLVSVFITGIVTEVCDDGTDCGNKVCCKSWFHYRCCPIEDGVCCDGGNQCCPRNQKCLRMGINNFCVKEEFLHSSGKNSGRSGSVVPSVLTENPGSSLVKI